MSNLIINDKSNLFIFNTYIKNKIPLIYTPFGVTSPIYTHSLLKPRSISQIGSEAYRSSLSRAFNKAKQKIYFNPDMVKFITLTYSKNQQDYEQVLTDVKIFLKTEKRLNKNTIKYVYVLEEQQRGALHIHMIATDSFQTEKNKNGYDSLKNWKHGFTTIHDIKNTDNNFKPYLYLFKYMKKSQRIGGRFVHSSRNTNNFEKLTDFEFNKLEHELVFTENLQLGYLDRKIKKQYYKKVI